MKILFVCKGNICRSPMAHGIMETLAKEANLDAIVDSAGTHNFNIGKPPDSRAYLTCLEHGIDISKLKARKVELSDFEKFDVIFAMDNDNIENLLALTSNQSFRSKIIAISRYIYSQNINEIKDPYFDESRLFISTYNLLYEACTNILNDVDHELGKTIKR